MRAFCIIMKRPNTKRTKDDVRRLTHLARPPRLEGRAKEAMMQPVRKAKKPRAEAGGPRKMQGHTQRERKEYQLRSKRH